MENKIELWEILVPTIFNDKTPIKRKFHLKWDEKVYTITKGLTILTPTKGKWVSEDNNLFAERMIPVRIACSRAQIEQIIDMTMDYYDQLAIMAYKVSEEVIIKKKNEKTN